MATQNYFLSPSGNDGNDGSKDKPFRSFQRARDAIRSLKRTMNGKLPSGGAIISAATGDYPPVGDSNDSVLELDPDQDSGAPGSPIVYQSDGSGPVQLLGGPRLDASAWSPVHDTPGMYSADLSKLGLKASDLGSLNPGGLGDCASNQLSELVYEGEPMVVARYPNLNYTRSDLPLPSFRHIMDTVNGSSLEFKANATDEQMLQRWADELAISGDVWIGGYWMYGWADSFCQVASIDSKSGLVAVHSSTPPVYGFKPKARYFGVNLFSELDQEREYYINKTSLLIFFRPPGGTLPSSPAYITLAPNVVSIGGAAEETRQAAEASAREQELARTRKRDAAAFDLATRLGIPLHVMIGEKGTPEYTARRRDFFDQKDAISAAEMSALQRLAASNGGVGSTSLHDIQLRGLTVSYGMYGAAFNNVNDVVFESLDASGNTAHSLRLTGFNNTLSNSQAKYAGCSAMAFEGGYQDSLIPSGSVASGNTATYYARWKRTYQPGIGFSGVAVNFTGNTVGYAPHIGMTGSGNDLWFFNNTFETAVYEVSDSGCWYSGRSWAHRGSKLFNNTFRNCKDIEPTFLGYPETHGIYYDDQLSAHEAAYNKFYDGYQGIFVGGGRRHSVHDNYFERIQEPFQMDDRGLDWQKQYCNATDGIFFTELEALHYQQPPWSTHYPELVNIRSEHPCVPCYNMITDNVWCPISGTHFSNTPSATAAKWFTTIANNTAVCL